MHCDLPNRNDAAFYTRLDHSPAVDGTRSQRDDGDSVCRNDVCHPHLRSYQSCAYSHSGMSRGTFFLFDSDTGFKILVIAKPRCRQQQ